MIKLIVRINATFNYVLIITAAIAFQWEFGRVGKKSKVDNEAYSKQNWECYWEAEWLTGEQQLTVMIAWKGNQNIFGTSHEIGVEAILNIVNVVLIVSLYDLTTMTDNLERYRNIVFIL